MGVGRERLTWEWDGSDWTDRTPANHPQWRAYHAMAYDSARGRVVLFSGGPAIGRFGYQDTWEWDGNDWLDRTPATGPLSRLIHALVYDSARARTVLFGGAGFDRDPLADTWEWDGAWIRRTPAISPSWRSHHAMAYDDARGRVVLFGGYQDYPSPDHYAHDTWEWDGNEWIERTPAASPPARLGHAMAYDSARARVVLFGGWQGSAWVNDTWEWDGGNWVQRSLAAKPTARLYTGMAYDSARSRMVLFGGGAGTDGWLYLGDTWEYGTIEACGHASNVAAFAPSIGSGATSAVAALGPPDAAAVSLGVGGSVVLELDESVPNGPGTELVVREMGAFSGGVDESYLVETSEHGLAYAFNGVCAGGDCPIDLAGAGLASARFVKITDRASGPGEPAPAAGADIDGVSVVTCDACDLTGDGADFDGDGVASACDDCPEHANPAQIDTDGDGAGDACDCAPADPLARPAEEVAGLAAEKLGAGSLRLSWSAASGAATYAIVRGELSVLSATELGDCVVGGVAALAWDDAELPSPGDGFTYLVRGESSACGPGTLGFGAFGLHRVDNGATCRDPVRRDAFLSRPPRPAGPRS